VKAKPSKNIPLAKATPSKSEAEHVEQQLLLFSYDSENLLSLQCLDNEIMNLVL